MKKIMKYFVVMMMIVSTIIGGLKLSDVNAWDNSTPREFTRVKEIYYPSWWAEKIPTIPKQWSTWKCTYNGKIAYCLEASKNTPHSGNYVADVIQNNEMVRKLMYYGYGGPGENIVHPGQTEPGLYHGGESDDLKYLFTHILLSIAYSGDAFGADIHELQKLGIGLEDIWNWVSALPDPGTGDCFFDNDDTAKLTAKYDPTTGLQKTNTIKFNARSQATVKLPLQDNVTIHIGDATQTGGTATISGGKSFYLTAPTTVNINDVSTTMVKAQGIERFTALAIKTGGGNYQTQGTWELDPNEAELYYNIDWADFGSLRLTKAVNMSKLEKNSKFRLVSTSFEGYDKTFEVEKNAKGDYELVIEGLPVGDYALTEVESEEYFAPSVGQWKVSIIKNETTSQVVVNNLRPVGTLNVAKTLEEERQGATLKADKDVTKTSYKITAVDETLDTISFKKLYDKDEGVKVGSGKCVIDAENGVQFTYSKGVQLTKGTDLGDGVYSVDENGELELTGLPIGKYQVVEQTCADGYVLNQTPYEVVVAQKDNSSKVYNVKVDQTNEITKIDISKSTIGGEEVEGASMQVIDKDGNVVDEWNSGKEPHKIDGLTSGETYTLHEDLAPAGYNMAQDFEFTVNKDGTVNHVTMIDTQTTVKKIDEQGNNLKGAKLQVVSKKTKNIVDQWITDDKEHICSDLTVGGEYILQELEAPKGYVKAKDIEFTVSGTENQEIKMTDMITKVDISKVDATTSKEIEGAELTLTDKETNEIVEKWTSTKESHRVTGLEVGKTYILHENLAPAGYLIASDVEFTIQDTGEVQKVVMKDELKPTVTVKTGDNSKIELIAGVMVISLAGLLAVIKAKRKQKNSK